MKIRDPPAKLTTPEPRFQSAAERKQFLYGIIESSSTFREEAIDGIYSLENLDGNDILNTSSLIFNNPKDTSCPCCVVFAYWYHYSYRHLVLQKSFHSYLLSYVDKLIMNENSSILPLLEYLFINYSTFYTASLAHFRDYKDNSKKFTNEEVELINQMNEKYHLIVDEKQGNLSFSEYYLGLMKSGVIIDTLDFNSVRNFALEMMKLVKMIRRNRENENLETSATIVLTGLMDMITILEEVFEHEVIITWGDDLKKFLTQRYVIYAISAMKAAEPESPLFQIYSKFDSFVRILQLKTKRMKGFRTVERVNILGRETLQEYANQLLKVPHKIEKRFIPANETRQTNDWLSGSLVQTKKQKGPVKTQTINTNNLEKTVEKKETPKGRNRQEKKTRHHHVAPLVQKSNSDLTLDSNGDLKMDNNSGDDSTEIDSKSNDTLKNEAADPTGSNLPMETETESKIDRNGTVVQEEFVAVQNDATVPIKAEGDESANRTHTAETSLAAPPAVPEVSSSDGDSQMKTVDEELKDIKDEIANYNLANVIKKKNLLASRHRPIPESSHASDTSNSSYKFTVTPTAVDLRSLKPEILRFLSIILGFEKHKIEFGDVMNVFLHLGAEKIVHKRGSKHSLKLPNGVQKRIDDLHGQKMDKYHLAQIGNFILRNFVIDLELLLDLTL